MDSFFLRVVITAALEANSTVKFWKFQRSEVTSTDVKAVTVSSLGPALVQMKSSNSWSELVITKSIPALFQHQALADLLVVHHPGSPANPHPH